MQELIDKFTLEHVGRAAGVFNPEKLLWLNSHYIKTAEGERLVTLLRPHLERLGLNPDAHAERLPAVVEMYRERSKTLAEMASSAASGPCGVGKAFLSRIRQASPVTSPSERAIFVPPMSIVRYFSMV